MTHVGANIMMPPADVVPPNFISPFVELADLTGALPLEIGGVAKIGGKYAEEDLPGQLPPMLRIDGAPRSGDPHGIADLEMLEDILDTTIGELVDSSRSLTPHIKDRFIKGAGRVHGGEAVRDAIASYAGSAAIDQLGDVIRGLARNAGVARVSSLEAASLFFAGGALAASSSKGGEEAIDDLQKAVEVLRAGGGAEGDAGDFRYFAAQALLLENCAHIASQNDFCRAAVNSLRLEAAGAWMEWLAVQNSDGVSMSRDTAVAVYNRILNGAQLRPDGRLHLLFTRHAANPSLEEAVRNLIRAAWSQFTGTLSGDSWDRASGDLLGAALLLEGNLDQFAEEPYLMRKFSARDYEGSFPGADKEGLADLANRLAFRAAVQIEAARKAQSEEG